MYKVCASILFQQRGYAPFPRPTQGKSCIILLRTARLQKAYVFKLKREENFGLFRDPNPVDQVHSFTCSRSKEDVDGVNQYFPCYSPFNV